MELVYPGQLPKIPSLIHYSLQRRIQGRPPPPPHFWTKLRPEGPKKRPPPPPYLRVWITGAPLICRSGCATALLMKPMQH